MVARPQLGLRPDRVGVGEEGAMSDRPYMVLVRDRFGDPRRRDLRYRHIWCPSEREARRRIAGTYRRGERWEILSVRPRG